MSNRLTKIYTRTGDKGKTSLATGTRMSKSNIIFEVMGDIDELNSHIGMVRYLSGVNTSDASQDNADDNADTEMDLSQTLTIIQHLLFNLGGEIAMLGSEYAYQGIEEKHIDWLESQIDTMNNQLKPLKEFILPAGNQLMCQLHLSRAVCRRAERHAICLNNALNNTSTDVADTDKDGQQDTILDGKLDGELSQTALKFLNRLSDWLFVASRFVGTLNQEANEVLWNKEALEAI